MHTKHKANKRGKTVGDGECECDGEGNLGDRVWGLGDALREGLLLC